MVRCKSVHLKGGYQKGVCYKKIGLQCQHLFTILGSIVTIIGGTCMIINEERESSLQMMNKVFIRVPKIKGFI